MNRLARRLKEVYRRLAVLPVLLLAARFHRYRSNLLLAKARLIRATRLFPDCFQAHLRLGAVYLEEHDFYRAKREFLLAREINPGKFRRLYPLVTGQTGDININLFYFPGFTDKEPEQASANFLREFIGEPLDEPAGQPVKWGDFASYREYRKFQDLGPFEKHEVENVDWDALLDRLPGDSAE